MKYIIRSCSDGVNTSSVFATSYVMDLEIESGVEEQQLLRWEVVADSRTDSENPGAGRVSSEEFVEYQR